MKRILACLLVLTSVFVFSSCSDTQVGTALQSIPKVNEGATRVMTFNICYGGSGKRNWRRRAPYLTKAIRQYMPDSIGFQEAHYQWIEKLLEALPEYGFIGVGRDNGKKSGEFNPIFYRRDKYEVVDSGTFWLSPTPDKVSLGWDAACNRICTWAVLKKKDTGELYAHYNTHLDNIGKLAQQKGAEVILEQMKQTSGIPTVVTGDFNSSEHTKVYQFMTQGGLLDSKYAAEDTMNSPTYHGYYPERVIGQSPIDYIFLTAGTVHPLKYQVVKEKVDGRFLSDHYGIYLDFVFGSAD